MKRKIFLTFILAVALSTSVALSHGNKVHRVPAGAVAFHWIGNLDGELVGYIAFIEGVQGPFFRDEEGDIPGVETAFFTVRLDLGTFPVAGYPIDLPVKPGQEDYVKASLIQPGLEFSVFYDENPNGDWSLPWTFSDGKEVATFKESAFLGTHILHSAEVDAEVGMGYNLFSSRLISSKSFWFNGQKVDFRKLVPNGVTINNVTNQDPDATAFGASAVAIGGDDDDHHRRHWWRR